MPTVVGYRQQKTTYNRINHFTPTSTVNVHKVAHVSDDIILLELENMTIVRQY